MKISRASSEQSAYDLIRAAPFTKIHGRPTRRNRDDLEEEVRVALCSAKVPGFAWSGDYGLLGELMEPAEYTTLTGETFVQVTEPAAFDPSIIATTTEFQMKKKTAIWDQIRESFYIRQGTLQAVSENIRDALDEPYHKQLKKKIIGYKKVTVREYFAHLDAKWCKLDTGTIKKMKESFYEPWNLVDHVTDFGIRLKDDQEHLHTNKIVISDADMTQFYVEQMMNSGMFEKQELKDWEKKPEADKTFDEATSYFEEIVADNETYESNAGGTAKRAGFESAMQVKDEESDRPDADTGDDIRSYI